MVHEYYHETHPVREARFVATGLFGVLGRMITPMVQPPMKQIHIMQRFHFFSLASSSVFCYNFFRSSSLDQVASPIFPYSRSFNSTLRWTLFT